MFSAARTATVAASVALAAAAGIAAPQLASAAPAAPAATVSATQNNLLGYYPVGATLVPGSKLDDVWELQTLLKGIGYDVKVTGTYDARTKTAVVAFQRKNRLLADGVVGKGTWQRLGMAYYPTLKIGAKGAAVTRLQALLRDRGWLTKVDGVYGSGTAAAVKKAQREAGLAQTGVADVRVTMHLLSGLGC